MLSHKKVQEVVSLLGQGLSKREVAAIAGVSHMSVYRISNDTHCTNRRQPVRCRKCGMRITSLPCRICVGQDVRPASFSFHEADSFILEIDLHGEERKRYLQMRRKVEAEIAAGTRTALEFAEPYN